MKKKIEPKAGPNMNKWKDYRITEDVEKYKHSGEYISSRDLYDKIQELNAFNRDLKIEVVDIEKVWDPEGAEATTEVVGIKIENGKLVIEVN